MNVLFISRPDLFPPVHGAAVRIVRSAEALARVGDRVFLLTEDRDAYWAREGERWVQRPLPPRLRAAEEWPGLRSGERWAERLCRRLGVPPDETFLYRPLFDPAFWLRALGVGRLERIEAYQAEFPGFALAAALPARLLGGRSLVVEHNVEYDRLAQTHGLEPRSLARLRSLELRALELVDQVVTVSDADRRRLLADGLRPGRVAVVPHGVELAPFDRALERRAELRRALRSRHGLPPDCPLLVFHGVLHYAPNAEAVRFIVDALLPRLLPDFPELRVLVAGMNPPRYFEHPALRFVGVVDELADFLVAADVAVCPLWSGGGTRLKLLEDFAAALPVVSTPKGAEGLRLEHGRELLLADGPEDFAAAVARLLRSPAERERLGAAARRFARRLGWDAVARALRALHRGEGTGEDWGARLLGGEAPGEIRPGREGRGAGGERGGRGRAVPAREGPGRAGRGEEPPRVDGHLPPDRKRGPLVMLLLLNRECNLRCAFCDLPARGGGRLEVARRGPALLDEARAIGTSVLVVTGGEPFLHPELFLLLRLARERGLSTNVTTNGTRVLARWEELLRQPPDSLSISLDGGPAVHDALRGRPGAHDAAVEALRRLAERRAATGEPPALSVYFTVTNRNLEELPRVWELARELGVGFDFWPVNHAPGLGLQSEAQRRRYLELVRGLAARDPAVAARRAYLEGGVDYFAGRLGRVRCLGLVEQYGVTPEGDLLPCCVWDRPELVVGNVFERPLSQLWTSEAARRARLRLFREGCGAGCYNHSLYAFQESTGLDFRLGGGLPGDGREG